MRTLLLLRGTPASGKSTFIKDNGLEPYTLCADTFRTMICNPVLDLKGDFSISQKNDRRAWDMLFQCLEERMKRGDFTVIDATHSTQKMVNNYKTLADIYKYTIFYLQLDVLLEECLRRNKERDKYKYVPEEAIKRVHSLIQNTDLGKGIKRINNLSEIDNFYIDDVSDKYSKVRVIGDIHGCHTSLKELLKDFNKDTLYVFLGDYLDRGIENKETLKLVMYLVKQPNVIMLEGNHELNGFKPFAYSLPIPSKMFIKYTIPEIIEDLSEEEIVDLKKQMRITYKRLRQAYAFKFGDNKYLCTHAGLTSVPKLLYISSDEMIRGIGGYDEPLSEMYEENYHRGMCQDFIQIYGHRGNNNTEHSINLEGEVEFGGYLKAIDIYKDRIEHISIKNEIYDRNYIEKTLQNKTEFKGIPLTENEEINKLIGSRLVKVKECNGDLYSLNFTEKAFRKKLWDDMTLKARGLFVNKISGEVVCRSYEKFFNIQEPHTVKYMREIGLKYPLIAKNKENGFLGLITYHNEELLFTSKSVTSGANVNMIKDLWNKENEYTKEIISNFLKENNVTIICEVLHFKDRHLIDFNREKLVILDIVKNELHPNGVHIDVNYSSSMFNKLYLELYNKSDIFTFVDLKVINSEEELNNYIDVLDKREDTEGCVLTDSNGFMFKYKVDFYNLWKSIRYCVNEYIRAYPNAFAFRMCREHREIVFMSWLVKKDIEYVKNTHIIDLRRDYFNEKDN